MLPRKGVEDQPGHRLIHQPTHASDQPELAAHIAELVASAPPLKPEQIDRIAAIIQAGGS